MQDESKYTQDYIKMILEHAGEMLTQEAEILRSGTQKEWSMSSGVVLESLSMASKRFNESDDPMERTRAFTLIEAILEEWTINVLPDGDVTIH